MMNAGTGGNVGGGGGKSEVIVDPIDLLDPSRPSNRDPNRNGEHPEDQGGTGNNPSNKDSEVNVPEGEQSNRDSNDEDSKTGSEGNSEDKSEGDSTKIPGKGEQSNGDGQGDHVGGEDPNGQDSPSADDAKGPLDHIKSGIKNVRDGVTLHELTEKLANGEKMKSTDVLFILGKINVSKENEEVQSAYEKLVSTTTSAVGVGKEVTFTQELRGKDKLKFLDWFKPSSYKDTFITHTKEAFKNGHYWHAYGMEKLAEVQAADNKKVKFIDLFRGAADRLVDGVKRVTDLGKKMTTGADGLIKSLGNGMANAADKAHAFFSMKLEDKRQLKEIFKIGKENTKSSALKVLLSGFEKGAGASTKGYSFLSSAADKLSKAGKAMAKSNIAKTAGNLVAGAKTIASDASKWGANVMDKIGKSRLVDGVKKFANSPIGKVGSGALSGLSILSGIHDVAGDGKWNVKVSGAFSIVSGGLGIAALVAAGTAAAPVLLGGALVAGVGALAFTYGPKAVSAWNNSKFGSAVNTKVKAGYNAVKDGLNATGKAIKDVGSNLVSSISSGLSGLFGSGG